MASGFLRGVGNRALSRYKRGLPLGHRRRGTGSLPRPDAGLQSACSGNFRYHPKLFMRVYHRVPPRVPSDFDHARVSVSWGVVWGL